MIFIIHGDNYTKSREILNQLIQKLRENSTQEISKLETSIKDITAKQLREELGTQSLFSDVRFLIFDITQTTKMNLDDYIDALKNTPKEKYVALLSEKELGKSNPFLKNSNELKAKVVLNNTIPTANIFKFVDAVFAKDRTQSYRELQRLLDEGHDPFYVFTMLLYGLRNLAHANLNTKQYKKMAPFTRTKVDKQVKIFPLQTLIKLYEDLYNLDLALKTGKQSPDLLLTRAIEKVLR